MEANEKRKAIYVVIADCLKSLDSISSKDKFLFEFEIISNSGGHLDS